MRGKGQTETKSYTTAGITPAHAGKRERAARRPPGHQDHPRACGEKFQASVPPVYVTGSPPRMRGKGQEKPAVLQYPRITPAHAGKSGVRLWHPERNGDHPRACGEKYSNGEKGSKSKGSPPRMRGKVYTPAGEASNLRITPAHAGKSRTSSLRQRTR